MGALFGALAYLFGYILKFWFNLVGNYGWAVILFAITIKAIIFPLTLKQQKSMKKNQELQPKLAELQNKYKDNQQAMSAEYQKFMKENNYHPFGGCLLMILQLLILFGVLYVVSNPITYMDKRSEAEIDTMLKPAIIAQLYSGDEAAFASDVDKYCDEHSGDKFVLELKETSKEITNEEVFLACYKQTNRYYELVILENEYEPSQISLFGINLGDITAQNPSNIKLWIFPVLTTIFYYISLWMVSRKQKKQVIKNPNGEEIQMPNMMLMNIMMPLMSGWISYSVPQGMGLYWFINSLIQIIIQFVSDKIVDKDKKNDNNEKKDVVLKPIDPIKVEDENNEENTEIKEDIDKEYKKNPNSSKKKKKNKKK